MGGDHHLTHVLQGSDTIKKVRERQHDERLGIEPTPPISDSVALCQ